MTAAAPSRVLAPETELMIAALVLLNTPPDLPRGTSGEAHPALDAAHRRLRAACAALPVEAAVRVAPALLDLRISAEMSLRAHRSVIGARAARRALSRCLAAYTAHQRVVMSRGAAA